MKQTFPLYISQDRIFSNSEKAMTLQDDSRLGEFKEGKVIFTKFEALFLIDTKKSHAIELKSNKPIDPEALLRSFIKKQKDFMTKYIVYKYLKSKGYIVKTGLKFGEEFRVYEKASLNDKHAKWIVFPISSNNKIEPKELISKSRITHSTGKKLLLAIVDSEEDITFYEIDWVRP